MINGNGDTSCVDIDHVTLENNYKNRFVDAYVQTTPLVPYRLRFWPRSQCDISYDPEKTNFAKVIVGSTCRFFMRFVLSQFGLTLIVFGWALLGALAFYKSEGPREYEQQDEVKKLQNEIAVDLATELRRLEGHDEKWLEMINKYIEKHEGVLLKAVKNGFGEGGGGHIWTYPGCILFAVSLLTTLGFGAPVPRTSMGRGMAVIFSAIGIPLHFLLVLNMGNLTAIKLQQLAYRSSTTELPPTNPPKWLKWFPLAALVLYYLMGVVLFGFLRNRDVLDSFMFPLDFTAAGGVASVYGYIKILYAIYLEIAVTLAALLVSLWQASATRGVVDIGLRLGLVTNT